MTWETPHPNGLRIDVNEGRPTIIGSTWVRRVPEGDDPWNGPVRIVGVHDLGERGGGLELCVTPIEFGPVMTASAESFAEAYKREEEAGEDPAERIDARLRELAARESA